MSINVFFISPERVVSADWHDKQGCEGVNFE